jgi:hypothetical protein
MVIRAPKMRASASIPRSMLMKARFKLLAALTVVLVLSACGGSSSPAASTSTGATAAAAKGIATPGAVSVVTAK